ncbi:guanylate kinase [Helicobacter bizzozeronii]|uniref:guanylate kinase n=1 Tax=Helicobacter bizzozeronii TaxID=56877 RepID=UPI000CEDE189|nr:guanylate kinase [Helicobacter bizzozeronii]
MSDHAYQILVLAGPSGAGKSTLIKHLLQNLPNVHFSISTTTRTQREGEIEGQHYYFVSQESFLEGIQNGQFLEWARVYDDYYGTSLKPIQEALQAKQLVLFDIDVQGHRSVRALYPKATSIFITTKNAQVLQDRLEKRQTDSPAVIARRMESAFKELQEVDLFDYVLVNDNLEEAKEMVLSVAKTLRYKQQMFPKDALYRAWGGN